MRDDFSYEGYRRLLEKLAQDHRLVRLRDLASEPEPSRFVILRHDVDYSPRAARVLAELEADAGWNATYFLLLSTPYYNLLDPELARLPRDLVERGHEVGLHYDVTFFDGFPAAERDRLLDLQVELLSALAGEPVVSIAMHQPGLHAVDPFSHRTDYVNAYDRAFCRAIAYVSDSCRAWRDSAWETLAGELPDRLQVLLHPVNWGDPDRDRSTIFREAHGDVARRIERLRLELMEKVEAHDAVVEHEAWISSREDARAGR